MKRLVLVFAMLWVATNMLATKYALIIAVGKYAPNTGWSATSAINDVKLLKPSLEKAGFVVTTLVDSQATHEGITIALNRLIRKVKAGDQVYLHFSGHGQQLKNPRSNEPDKLDEAMVPYDAGLYYSKTNYGQKHLRDKELNLYITRLRTKLKRNGMLLVALDACHSGDATRAIPDLIRMNPTSWETHADPHMCLMVEPNYHNSPLWSAKLAVRLILAWALVKTTKPTRIIAARVESTTVHSLS